MEYNIPLPSYIQNRKAKRKEGLHLFLQVLYEGLIMGTIYALYAMGIALIWGVMNILSFSQGEFMMIAMYLTFFINAGLGWDPLAAMPIVIVVMFLFGVLIYRTIITKALKGPVLSQRLVTYALGMILTNGMILIAGGQTKSIAQKIFSGSFDIIGITISKEKLVLLCTSIVVTVLLFWFMNRTKMGKAIRATSQDKEAAGLVGINTQTAYTIAFAISTAIAGAAGSAMTYYYYFTPSIGANFMIFGFIAVCLGGFGSIGGAFVGGIIMGLVDLFAGTYLSVSYKYLAVSVIFLLIVTFKPKGLFGR